MCIVFMALPFYDVHLCTKNSRVVNCWNYLEQCNNFRRYKILFTQSFFIFLESQVKWHYDTSHIAALIVCMNFASPYSKNRNK